MLALQWWEVVHREVVGALAVRDNKHQIAVRWCPDMEVCDTDLLVGFDAGHGHSGNGRNVLGILLFKELWTEKKTLAVSQCGPFNDGLVRDGVDVFNKHIH